jgi:hypothetical protein
MRYFILGLFAAFAVAVPVAGAAAVKPTPSYSIAAAKVSGKNVKFDLLVKAASNVPGCKGTVTASHKISKKKTVSWTGKLKTTGTDCATTIKGKLPKAKFGKKVKFSIKFPGNKAIKKFSGTKSLTLVSPPLPPPPVTPGSAAPPAQIGPQAFGKWTGFRQPEDESKFMFTIKSPNYAVPGFSSWLGGNNSMNCGPGYEATQVPFNWSTPFTLSGPVGVAVSTDNGPNFSNMIYTFNFAFTTANEGSGNFSALGEFNVGGGVFKTCSLSYNFRLQWTGPEF